MSPPRTVANPYPPHLRPSLQEVIASNWGCITLLVLMSFVQPSSISGSSVTLVVKILF